ncbi:hypothetical protein [Paraburkholderia sp. BL6665CI2N2]|nr:hypothetical protein [Paraburkholderia sp. BL6665CI2N2]
MRFLSSFAAGATGLAAAAAMPAARLAWEDSPTAMLAVSFEVEYRHPPTT